MERLSLDLPDKDKPIDPIQIFNNATLRGGIENIWDTQSDALKLWHLNHRDDPDVVIQMNTGGGKTLVRLLAAQSLVNETEESVLYVCANNQLVEQTSKKAQEVGLNPANRIKSCWHRQTEYETGETFCITNYHALFNGYSVFKDSRPNAIVFDDAHVAESIIRSCFSLSVDCENAIFKAVLDVLRPHFVDSVRKTHFEQVSNGNYTHPLFVPLYVSWREADRLRKVMTDNGVGDGSTKFAWAHIASHLAHCVFILDGRRIEVTPISIPLHTMGYFDSTRRIYLTATLWPAWENLIQPV